MNILYLKYATREWCKRQLKHSHAPQLIHCLLKWLRNLKQSLLLVSNRLHHCFLLKAVVARNHSQLGNESLGLHHANDLKSACCGQEFFGIAISSEVIHKLMQYFSFRRNMAVNRKIIPCLGCSIFAKGIQGLLISMVRLLISLVDWITSH